MLLYRACQEHSSFDKEELGTFLCVVVSIHL